MRIRYRKLIYATILMVVCRQYAHSGVSLGNGNFYIDYTDGVVEKGGNIVTVERIYNSTAIHNGAFGFGWGSEFETFLVVNPAGVPVIFLNGSGAREKFVPEFNDEKYFKQLEMSKKVMLGLRMNEGGNISSIENELNNPDTRMALWMR